MGSGFSFTLSVYNWNQRECVVCMQVTILERDQLSLGCPSTAQYYNLQPYAYIPVPVTATFRVIPNSPNVFYKTKV